MDGNKSTQPTLSAFSPQTGVGKTGRNNRYLMGCRSHGAYYKGNYCLNAKTREFAGRKRKSKIKRHLGIPSHEKRLRMHSAKGMKDIWVGGKGITTGIGHQSPHLCSLNELW